MQKYMDVSENRAPQKNVGFQLIIIATKQKPMFHCPNSPGFSGIKTICIDETRCIQETKIHWPQRWWALSGIESIALWPKT